MLNYLRYFIVTLLLFSFFYSYSITIEQSVIEEKIAKKLPMKIDKKGFLLTIEKLEIVEIVNNTVSSNLAGSVQISQQSRWSKFLPKKSLHFKLKTKTVLGHVVAILLVHLLRHVMVLLVILEGVRFRGLEVKFFRWKKNISTYLFYDFFANYVFIAHTEILCFGF